MGRRRKDDLGRYDKKIQIVVGSPLHARLVALSESTSQTMSKVCRTILNQAVPDDIRQEQLSKRMLGLRRLDAN